MVLFVTAGFVGLIVLLRACRRFTKDYKKKRLQTPKVHHYPITGDSSNSSNSNKSSNSNRNEEPITTKGRSTDINILEESLSTNINILEKSLSNNAGNELSGVSCCTVASSHQFIGDAENEHSGSTCCTMLSSPFCNEKTPNQKEWNNQNTTSIEMVSKGNVGDLGSVNLFVDGESVANNNARTEYTKSVKTPNKNRGNGVNLVDKSVANNSVQSVKSTRSMEYMGKSLSTWMESMPKCEDDGYARDYH
mmetsp:Transcript_24882/g.29327  ORF Transcript_24882/g.29327 Transcript_24882/m.29327 type:complete len:249 (-) Transcript_24882:56-802(-)